MAYNYPRTLVLLSTETASTSANLPFTSLITTDFTAYYISIRDIIPVTNNVSLQLTFSTDNGSTYLSANYAYSHCDQTSVPAQTFTNSTSAANILLAGGISNTTSRGFSADIQIVNMDVGTNSPNLWGWGCHFNQAGTFTYSMLSGYNSGTTAINAIKFDLSSGNIASGTINLYGLVET